MAWFDTPKKTEVEKKDDEVELKPADVKAKLDKIDVLAEGQAAQGKRLEQLDSITAYIEEQKVERDRVKAAKQQQERQEKQKTEEEELDWIADPENAMKHTLAKSMQPLVESQINTQARLLSKDVFDDQQFEYYTDSTFKNEVDSLINSLPLAQRANAEAQKNCYYVVAGRKAAEIKEGKIKSKFSATSSSGDGTGNKGGKTDEVIILTEAEKKAAKIFGMKEEDYAKSKKEMSYV
jgi:phage I-like protein